MGPSMIHGPKFSTRGGGHGRLESEASVQTKRLGRGVDQGTGEHSTSDGLTPATDESGGAGAQGMGPICLQETRVRTGPPPSLDGDTRAGQRYNKVHKVDRPNQTKPKRLGEGHQPQHQPQLVHELPAVGLQQPDGTRGRISLEPEPHNLLQRKKHRNWKNELKPHGITVSNSPRGGWK